MDFLYNSCGFLCILMFPKNPMEVLWIRMDSHGFLFILIGISIGILMDIYRPQQAQRWSVRFLWIPIQFPRIPIQIWRFLRIPREFIRIPIEFLWSPVWIHENSYGFLDSYWIPMDFYAILMIPVDSYGIPMDSHRTRLDLLWIPMDSWRICTFH